MDFLGDDQQDDEEQQGLSSKDDEAKMTQKTASHHERLLRDEEEETAVVTAFPARHHRHNHQRTDTEITFDNALLTLQSVDDDLEDDSDRRSISSKSEDDANDAREKKKTSSSKDDDDDDENEKKKKNCFSRCLLCCQTACSFDPESTVFALRICVSVTIASLFHLAFSIENNWPQSSWVYVTAAIISWQSRVDTATVLYKSIQRTMGTIFGAVLAMMVGMLSLSPGIPDVHAQSIFLGCAIAVHAFLYPYLCDRLGKRNSYAAFMGNFTFGIVVLSFYNTDAMNNPWRYGAFRVVNIIIGCAISILVSLLLWPISTKHHLVKKITQQLKMTGVSCELELDAAVDVFLKQKKLPSLVHLCHDDNDGMDPVHDAYIKNIERWNGIRSYFPVLKYDPWFITLPKAERVRFRHQMAVRLCRSFRIQLNLVSMDAVLRHDPNYTGPREALNVISSIGKRSKTVLDLENFSQQERDEATKTLLEEDLVRLRHFLVRMTDQLVAMSTIDVEQVKHHVRVSSGLPALTFTHHQNQNTNNSSTSSDEQVLLVLQLAEQLILRVARLHFYCMEYDEPDTFALLVQRISKTLSPRSPASSA